MATTGKGKKRGKVRPDLAARVLAADLAAPGLSLNELARRCGVSRTLVSRVLRAANRLKGRCRDDEAVPVDEPAPARVPASSPTDAPPGTEAKVLVLLARREAGEELWHPLDRAEAAPTPSDLLRRQGRPPGRGREGGEGGDARRGRARGC